MIDADVYALSVNGTDDAFVTARGLVFYLQLCYQKSNYISVHTGHAHFAGFVLIEYICADRSFCAVYPSRNVYFTFCKDTLTWRNLI